MYVHVHCTFITDSTNDLNSSSIEEAFAVSLLDTQRKTHTYTPWSHATHTHTHTWLGPGEREGIWGGGDSRGLTTGLDIPRASASALFLSI